MTYHALDMYFPLFIFFAGRSSQDSAMAAAICLSTVFVFFAPSWSFLGVVSCASLVVEVFWSTASRAASQSRVRGGDMVSIEVSMEAKESLQDVRSPANSDLW